MNIFMNYKKLVSFSIVVSLFISVNPVFAISTPIDTQKFLEQEVAIIEPGVLPNSFWYWGDMFGEQLRFIFTVGKEKKADYLIDIAKERLAEMKILSEAGINKYSDDLLNTYDDEIAKAEKFYKELREQGLLKGQELQVETEKQILLNEVKIKKELKSAPDTIEVKQRQLVGAVGAWFKQVLSHLSWKREAIKVQRKEVLDE